jgi:hypothetical protein
MGKSYASSSCRCRMSRIKGGMTSNDRPSGTSQLVGQRARHHVRVASRQKRTCPVREVAVSLFQTSHVGSGALDEQASDILVAASADSEKVGSAARTVLAGNKSKRRGEITTASELLAVAHF